MVMAHSFDEGSKDASRLSAADGSRGGSSPISNGKGEGSHGGGNAPGAPSPDSELKNLRTLMMIAGIGGPFSFVIGGVVLSTVALVCAIIAFGKFKRLSSMPGILRDARRIKRAVVFSVVISSAALVWNVVWFAIVLPEMWQTLLSQDFSSLYGDSSSTAPGKTIWD